MIIQAVANLGENVVKNNFTEKWAFQRKNIKELFYISRDSELLRWESLKKPIQKDIPIAVCDDCLSTARVKVEDNTPYLFFDWIKNFHNEESRNQFVAQVKEYRDAINHPLVECISKFILNFDWESFVSANKVDENGYFYVFVEDEETKDLFEDTEIVHKTNQFILRKIQGKYLSQMDSLGREGTFIRKSSGLIQSGPTKARLITSLAYEENYYDEKPVCNISFLTEFYMFVGMEYLINNGAFRIGSRVYALYSVDNGTALPLWFDWKRYLEVFRYDNYDWESWEDCKKMVKKRLKNCSLTYLEFDTVAKGRISSCVCYEHNEVEAMLAINNLFEFIDKTTDFTTGKSFGNRALFVIRALNHEQKDTYRTQLEYGHYIQNVLRGEYQAVIRTVITPRIVQLGVEKEEKGLEEFRGYARWVSKLMIHSDIQELPELYQEVEYLMGYLLGLCRIYEKKRGMPGEASVVETYLKDYICCPNQTWERIWSRIANGKDLDEYSIRRITKTVEQIAEMNWGKDKHLESHKIVEGYSLTLGGYWKKLTIRYQMKEIFDYMLEGEIHYVPLPMGTGLDGERCFEVTIKEVVKEEEK